MGNLISPNGRLGVPVTRADGRTDVLSAVAMVTAPAGAAPLAGTVTSAGVNATQGAAAFAAGVATIGPFTPDLARDIVLKLWSPDNAQFSAQLFDSIDGGVTKLPLTIFDQAVGGPYTVPVNSAITSASVAGTTSWLIVTVTAGTLNYWLGQ